MIRWLFAALHLLALAIGAAGVWARADALRKPVDNTALQRAFRGDMMWGVAALLWISTGLVRAFSSLEKGTDYYLTNHAFLTKMALLVIILVLEVKPMMTLIRWRVQFAKGETLDLSEAGKIARISRIQALLIVLMVLAAAAMARGLG